jgi:DNA-binding NarL/FixJ family response regulator
MIRILIVHDSPLISNLLSAALQDEPDISVVGCAASIPAALKLAEQTDIDVALVGIRLPEQGALKITTALTGADSQIKVLVFGLNHQDDQIIPYIEAGAAGYILKSESFTNLIQTIRLAQQGKALVSPEIAAALMQRLAELAQFFPGAGSEVIDLAKLTPREQEVTELLGENLSNQEIAERLFIEVGTVKQHVHNVLNKLGMESRQQVAALLTVFRKFTDEGD